MQAMLKVGMTCSRMYLQIMQLLVYNIKVFMIALKIKMMI